MKNSLSPFIFLVLAANCMANEPVNWYTYNPDERRDHECFQIKFPYKYIIDPKSTLSEGIEDFPGFKTVSNSSPKEEDMNVLRVSNSEGTIQISARYFQSIGKEFKERGFSSVREVLISYIETPWLANIIKRDNFEIIRYQTRNKLEIYLFCLPYNVEFGWRIPCRVLSFKFKNSDDYIDNKKEVEEIIDNFIPY